MRTVQAIYENGVFRPIRAVDLPEHAQVEFEPRLAQPDPGTQSLDEVYSFLKQRFHTGHRDTAERHNEHQP